MRLILSCKYLKLKFYFKLVWLKLFIENASNLNKTNNTIDFYSIKISNLNIYL